MKRRRDSLDTDAIAVHSYTDGAWPEDFVPGEMSAVHAALPSAYASMPIWSTEGGSGTNSQFSSAASDRRAFIARAAANEWDAIIMTRTAFQSIELSPHAQAAYQRRELDQ